MKAAKTLKKYLKALYSNKMIVYQGKKVQDGN
jgi:hypothetical protein